MVLGISGVGLVVLSAGLLAILALPLSVAALVVGRRSRDRMAGGAAGTRGLAQAGLVLGRLGVALSLVALVAWTLAFALGGDLLDDLQRELDDKPQQDHHRPPGGDGTFVKLRLAVAVARAGAHLLPL